MRKKKTLRTWYSENFDKNEDIDYYKSSVYGKFWLDRYHFTIWFGEFTSIYYSEMKYFPHPGKVTPIKDQQKEYKKRIGFHRS